MKAGAIICEFNPLHNGHRHILSVMRDSLDSVVCVMSGNFTQRSESAIYDKYERAEAAIAAGADLVVSLPFPWSSASGEFFAAAGVSIAERLGCEDLFFGVNSSSEALRATAEYLKSEEYARDIKTASRDRSNESFGAGVIFENLLRGKGLALPAGENDILALEYYRSAKVINPVPVLRLPYGDSVASASSIREILLSGSGEISGVVPRVLIDRYRSLRPCRRENLFELERVFFRMNREFDFNEIEAAAGGCGGRLIKAALASLTGEEMLSLAKSKKYTDSRLRRAALYSLAGVKVGSVKETPCFTELLAANKTGLEFLAEQKKNRDIFVITKPADYMMIGEGARQYEAVRRSDEIYTMCRGISDSAYYMKKSPYIEKR